VPERGDPLVLTPFVNPIEGLAARREHLDHHGRIGHAVVVGGGRPAGDQQIRVQDGGRSQDLEAGDARAITRPSRRLVERERNIALDGARGGRVTGPQAYDAAHELIAFGSPLSKLRNSWTVQR
jgi:hypothetical protein